MEPTDELRVLLRKVGEWAVREGHDRSVIGIVIGANIGVAHDWIETEAVQI